MILLFLACEPGVTEVVMSGVVLDAPAGAGSVVPEATLSIFDASHEAGETTVTDEEGAFNVTVPAGAIFFLHVEAEGFVSTGFQGTSGLSDFSAGGGFPWIATPAYLQATKDAWVGCPDVDLPGTMIVGEARFSEAQVDPAFAPPAPDIAVALQDSVGETHSACYIDETGVVDPALTVTSPTGAFAIFGVPEGAFLMTMTQALSSGDVAEAYEFDAPADGMVPIYPVMVTEFQ